LEILEESVKKVEHLSLTIIFFLIIFSGCATKEAVKVSDEEVLKERVMAYWNLKMHEEFDKSYQYELPLYRKNVTMVSYIKGFNTRVVKWLGASIDNVKRQDDTAMIDLNVKVKVNVPGLKDPGHDSLIKEKWVKVEGIWYHVPEGFTGS